MNSLSIKELSKTYKNGVKALENVSLEIENGIFGLLGPNGAGKSSLMRTLAALQTPDSGEIHFNEIDIIKDPQAIRKQLGYLPQEFGVYPGFSAFQLLDHLAILKGMIDKKARYQQIEFLLQQTNLFELRKRAVNKFSGGMRQRFGIAQALLGNPRLIIVDEPTAGLDPEERNRFLDLLSEVAEEKIVILSTHIVEDVRDLCSRLSIIHQGKLVEYGDPDELIDRLEGKVWQGQFPASGAFKPQEDLKTLSSRLFSGKRRIRVLAENQPSDDYQPVSAGLEDVYFSTF